MADIVFYAKPGCLTNRRQQALLRRLGHRVTVRDLLSEPWTAERLYEFLKSLPIIEWFNLAAPAIKLGTLDPAGLDASAALRLLVDDPVLIRRPLMETGDDRYAGFESSQMQTQLGINAQHGRNHAACSRLDGHGTCSGGG
jgi:nitrogenase-associated protein